MPANDYTQPPWNPYELLRKPAEDRVSKLRKLRLAGTLTDDAARQIDDECKLQSHLAKANHRDRMHRLAFELSHTATPIYTKQAGCITLAELIALLVAEVTANNYPHDLPFHPSNQDLADDIGRIFSYLLRLVKDQILAGKLPVRLNEDVQISCNADPAVVAWCNDPDSISQTRMLCTTLDDARALAQAFGLKPLRELEGESAQPTEQGSVQPPEKEASPAPPDPVI